MIRILIFLLIFSSLALAQKRPMLHSDYDGWNAIAETKIIPNGHWVSYLLKPQDGDSKLVFYPLLGNAIDSIERASDVWISQDSKWAAFKISPSKKHTRDAKLAKKKKEEMPKDSIGIHSFVSFENIKFADVKSFVFPEKSTDWIAFLNYPDTKKDTSVLAKKKKKESDENGSNLSIYSLVNKTLRNFPYVYKYHIDPTGSTLLFATTGSDSTLKEGLYSFSTADQELTFLNPTKGIYKHLTSDENGKYFAAILDPDTTKRALVKNPTLMTWSSKNLPKTICDSSNSLSPKYPFVSADFEPVFSKDGGKLFFGINQRTIIKDTNRLDEETVNLDIWNWKDKRTMPQQLANLKTDLKESFLAVYATDKEKMTQLATEEIPKIKLSKDAQEGEVLGISDEKYAYQHWFLNPPTDLYAISTENGQKTQILQNKRISNAQISPEGKFVIWYSLQDTAWYSYQIRNNKTYKLTSSTIFSDLADDDHPDEPNSYGLGGFTKNDEEVWLYDKYDIWAINPSKPSESKRITNGREGQISYRYISLDEKETQINTKQTLVLSIFDNKSKESGYAKLNLGETNTLETVLQNKLKYSSKISKAKDTNNDLVFTAESFEVFPDLLHSNDYNFKTIKKISTANPQQNNIQWGAAEMVSYNSLDNKRLEGILYKPANFDPHKKYPMITYFYEKMSDEIYNYIVPQPARSSINFSYYTSNGYCIFVPDIVYKIGYPGQSAYDCILPGVKTVVDLGFVDSTRLGVQGHSWGGYQIAWLLTKTNIFRAAEAGAPVANMTSAYGGIRWESGFSRQAQYERTQSRLGATLWEDPKKYLENSPLFYLPNVKTPVLMMHNDDDGAVPWYQGIEMFMGLKRLGKPVWMLNYNGEKHGLMQRKNRMDWSQRMSQYFDFYLKDAPQPEWMSSGIKATEKTLKYGFKLD